MASPEHAPEHHPQRSEPLPSNVLPPELVDYLQNQVIACIAHATDTGTVLIMKMPGTDIYSVRGPVPIWIRQELYTRPSAPVIRMVVTIYDQIESPLAVETFFNVADETQRADLAALATQDELAILFFDEALAHQLTKVVAYQGSKTAQILATAERLVSTIPREEFDFDTAKAAVMAATSL
jgi:hypothetical protein